MTTLPPTERVGWGRVFKINRRRYLGGLGALVVGSIALLVTPTGIHAFASRLIILVIFLPATLSILIRSARWEFTADTIGTPTDAKLWARAIGMHPSSTTRIINHQEYLTISDGRVEKLLPPAVVLISPRSVAVGLKLQEPDGSESVLPLFGRKICATASIETT